MAFINHARVASFSLNIFIMNNQELQKGLAIVQTPEIGIKLMSEAHREAGDQVHREISRLMHNFLASAKTLVDHTRAFLHEHYENTPIRNAYQARIDTEFANDEICRFVHDLRNYMLHRGLSYSKMFLTIDQVMGLRVGIALDASTLKEWSNWSGTSKKFLMKQGEDIDPSTLFSAYYQKIMDLQTWLRDALRAYHRDDLDQLAALQSKLRSLEADPA